VKGYFSAEYFFRNDEEKLMEYLKEKEEKD